MIGRNIGRILQTSRQASIIYRQRKFMPCSRLFSSVEVDDDLMETDLKDLEDPIDARASKKKKILYQKTLSKEKKKSAVKEKEGKQDKKDNEDEEDLASDVVSRSGEVHNPKAVNKTMFGLVIERYLNRYLVQRLTPINNSSDAIVEVTNRKDDTEDDDPSFEYQQQLQMDYNYTHNDQYERALYNLNNYFLCYPSSKMMYENSISIVPGDYITFYTLNETAPGLKELNANALLTNSSDQNTSPATNELEKPAKSPRIPPYPSLPLNQYQAGWITHALPRSNVLSRPSASSESRKKVVFKSIASNVTQLFILVASRPYVPLPTIDRYLITAKLLKIPKVYIIINKYDLGKESEKLYHELLYYEKFLNTKIICTSIINNNGINNIKNLLINQTSVFVGQSGVGKSSLINSLLPNLSIKTNPLISNERFGAHTTSNARLYHLYHIYNDEVGDVNGPPSRGVIIDSPGIREMGTWHLSLADIVYGFDEIYDYSRECKFRNCNHLEYNGEDDCAVYKAVKEGNIHESRYASYLQLIKQIGYAE